jgi:TAP-like protein.
LWQRGNIPADYREPVSSNLPVLIFSGNLDPITPPQRGEEVAKYLPNSRHVVIPEAGHGVDGLSDAGCVRSHHHRLHGQRKRERPRHQLRRSNGAAAVRYKVRTTMTGHHGLENKRRMARYRYASVHPPDRIVTLHSQSTAELRSREVELIASYLERSAKS